MVCNVWMAREGRGEEGRYYRYVNQSSFDNKARSKPLPVRLIRARFEPGIWRRCSSGFVGIGSVGDGDFSESDLAFSLRRFRVPIWCSVLCLVLVFLDFLDFLVFLVFLVYRHTGNGDQ